MLILNRPNDKRPREKLIAFGERSLTDGELVAIFLRTGAKGQSALDIANELLATFGSLKNLLEAPMLTLLAKPGIGPSKFVTLKAALELGRRCLTATPEPGTQFDCAEKSKRFLKEQLSHHPSEVFTCLFMDINCRLLQFDKLFFGTVHESVVYPREIIRRGLLYNAARIIISHNHPSGLAKPSEADKLITQTISLATAMVDIELIDHIIIGRHQAYSFKEHGLI